MMPSKSVAKVGRDEDGDLEGVRHVEHCGVAEAVGDARDDDVALSPKRATIWELSSAALRGPPPSPRASMRERLDCVR